MKTVAAVVHEQGGPFLLEEVSLDEPRADEVLVRMVATGLCHTDLSVRAGYIPFPLPGVMGHEGAGIVEAVGSAVKRVAPGDRVLATFTSCGHCANCTGGEPAYCHTFIPSNLVGGTRSDGSYTKLPLERMIRCYPFEDIELAAADAAAGATIKPVLVFD